MKREYGFLSVAAPTHLYPSCALEEGVEAAGLGTHWWALNQLIICHHLYSQVLHL
jgi:hypothetical protein